MDQFWADSLVQLQFRLGAPEWAAPLVWGVTYFIGALILANFALVLALLLIWITRKVISRIQDRIGPNRVGPKGLFQTVADALKLLSKEDIQPAQADTIAYILAPMLAVFGVLMSLAVIPFGPGLIGVDLKSACFFWWRWVPSASWRRSWPGGAATISTLCWRASASWRSS